MSQAPSTRGKTQGRFSAGLPLSLRESTLQRLRLCAGLLVWAVVVSECLTLYEVFRGHQVFFWGVHLSRLALMVCVYWGKQRLGNQEISAQERLFEARIGVWLVAFFLAFQECYYWPASGVFSPAGLSRVSLVASLAPVLIPDGLLASLLFALLVLISIPLAHWASLLFGLPAVALSSLMLYFVRHLVSVGAAWMAAATVHQLREAISADYGSYKLLRKLGQGGFGQVWEATHLHHKRLAAIKILHPQSDEEMSARFLREAETLSQLECPHTVRLFDYGSSENGQLYLVMELLKGVDLDQLVRRYGPQPPERVVTILTQVCLSLEEAHSRGLIHRDLKPANLFLCRIGVESDFVKLIDFGLVKPNLGGSQVTRSHALVGTPDFMAPEQIQGLPLDGRADLYSLGAVGYFLLTGTPVFPAPQHNPMEVLMGHLHLAPQPPSQRLGRELPEELVRVLMRCLEKEPDRRFAHARALHEELSCLPRWTRAQAADWWERHGLSG